MTETAGLAAGVHCTMIDDAITIATLRLLCPCADCSESSSAAARNGIREDFGGRSVSCTAYLDTEVLIMLT